MGQSHTTLKAGVHLLDHITADVFEYKSTIFKTSVSVKDSLL